MRVQISNHTSVQADENAIRRVYAFFVKAMNLSDKLWLSLVICDSEQMRSINNHYRGVDATTDVLTFPSDLISGNKEATEEFLGEILIDINYLRNTNEPNAWGDRFIEVLLHGLLHLMGYDHINTQQKEQMETLETKLMTQYKQQDADGLR